MGRIREQDFGAQRAGDLPYCGHLTPAERIERKPLLNEPAGDKFAQWQLRHSRSGSPETPRHAVVR
jgi:hypothetical protein